jgi:hypothetical protein
MLGAVLVGFLALGAGYAAAATCSFTTVGTTMQLKADCTTTAPIFIPNGVTTFDGQGHTITAVDPSGDHFRGAVLTTTGAVAHIKRVTITASNLKTTIPCNEGNDRLRGIFSDPRNL